MNGTLRWAFNYNAARYTGKNINKYTRQTTIGKQASGARSTRRSQSFLMIASA